ncbi:uncharacterized protein LOC132299176 isoform X2 [Cornus florida]|uniref:uncharacterized protein LOC132299176 isoform X2 n=1 Tax=Cornus florida TaxID=4283 RepID=UPI00289E0758|nr:uncharacterized protein LOC132299176 isoform X2 [Cornus florida]
MGMVISFMARGSSSTNMDASIGTHYEKLINIKEFEEFHKIILDIFNIFNASLPGGRYEVPGRKKECFTKWNSTEDESKKKELLTDLVNVSKLDQCTLITGLVTPPVAMAAKKAGERVPQLRLIKSIPDVAFVPSATVVALVTAKFVRRIFQGNVASSPSQTLPSYPQPWDEATAPWDAVPSYNAAQPSSSWGSSRENVAS